MDQSSSPVSMFIEPAGISQSSSPLHAGTSSVSHSGRACVSFQVSTDHSGTSAGCAASHSACLASQDAWAFTSHALTPCGSASFLPLPLSSLSFFASFLSSAAASSSAFSPLRLAPFSDPFAPFSAGLAFSFSPLPVPFSRSARSPFLSFPFSPSSLPFFFGSSGTRGEPSLESTTGFGEVSREDKGSATGRKPGGGSPGGPSPGGPSPRPGGAESPGGGEVVSCFLSSGPSCGEGSPPSLPVAFFGGAA